mgnify:CR=1 FL=1
MRQAGVIAAAGIVFEAIGVGFWTGAMVVVLAFEARSQHPQVGLLEEIIGEIEAAPHSAAALTLYAMVNTMDYEQAGCLFKLNKLRDVGEAERRLAYRLMELMVAGGNSGAAWQQAKARMDELVRAG